MKKFKYILTGFMVYAFILTCFNIRINNVNNLPLFTQGKVMAEKDEKPADPSPGKSTDPVIPLPSPIPEPTEPIPEPHSPVPSTEPKTPEKPSEPSSPKEETKGQETSTPSTTSNSGQGTSSTWKNNNKNTKERNNGAKKSQGSSKDSKLNTKDKASGSQSTTSPVKQNDESSNKQAIDKTGSEKGKIIVHFLSNHKSILKDKIFDNEPLNENLTIKSIEINGYKCFKDNEVIKLTSSENSKEITFEYYKEENLAAGKENLKKKFGLILLTIIYGVTAAILLIKRKLKRKRSI